MSQLNRNCFAEGEEGSSASRRERMARGLPLLVCNGQVSSTAVRNIACESSAVTFASVACTECSSAKGFNPSFARTSLICVRPFSPKLSTIMTGPLVWKSSAVPRRYLTMPSVLIWKVWPAMLHCACCFAAARSSGLLAASLVWHPPGGAETTLI